MGQFVALLSGLITFLACSFVQADVAPYATLTLDSSNVVSGGIEHGHAFRGLVDVGVEADVAYIEGGQVFMQALMKKGSEGVDHSGDIQGFSNIDSHNFESIFEVWYGQSLLDDQLGLKLGWMDGNSDFAATEHGAEFINSSMGFSPTISAMPTYPDTVLAVTINAQLSESSAVNLGVFDGKGNDRFEQTFTIAQYAYQVDQTNLVLGYWNHSEQSEAQGWYASVDHHVTEDVAVYSQFGMTDKSQTEIDRHMGFGVVSYAPMNRSQDHFGLAVTQVNVTAQAENETTFEMFYSIAIENSFTLKPDVQYINHPSGDTTINDAVVLTLRAVTEY